MLRKMEKSVYLSRRLLIDLNDLQDQIVKGKPMPMATEMRAIWDTARNYMGLATTKKMSPEEAVRKMQQNVEKKVSEMNR